jgi:hypothetical protein
MRPALRALSQRLSPRWWVTPSYASPAVRDMDPSSSDGLPICFAVDAADWATVGSARVAIALGVTTVAGRPTCPTVNGVASDYAAPTVRVTDASSVIYPSLVCSSMGTSIVAMDNSDCGT